MRRVISHIFLVVLVVASLFGTATGAEPEPGMATVVSDGWHPWYEVKVDPENASNLIVCGTKWDREHNAPFGFVYSSADQGRTWKVALEDKSTAWVTEHSCAFGGNHRAYFISEASKVIDDRPHHELGTTRLFLSIDGGRTWKETAQTGWADWSTSAVSSASGELYTFYNATSAEPGRSWGSSVGLLIASPDGRRIAGPFFESTMQGLGFQGVFPSSAVALKSGAVAALYYGIKQTPQASEAQLGVIRGSPGAEPLLTRREIWTTPVEKDCFGFDDGALANDVVHNRLYAVYVDRCNGTQVRLTISEDEGKTWSKSVRLGLPDSLRPDFYYPSLTVDADGTLMFLWEQGQRSGQWRVAPIRNERISEPVVGLTQGSENLTLRSDSLWIWTYPSHPFANTASTPVTTLQIRAEPNTVWRASGLLLAGTKVLAVWPVGSQDGMRLYAQVLGPEGSSSAAANQMRGQGIDVTSQSVVLYRGPLEFDAKTDVLKVCMSIGNRGQESLRAPIRLQLLDLSSTVAKFSVLNSSNGVRGVGAMWDISGSLTGDRIPPRMASNPFCLLFSVQVPPRGLPQDNDELMDLNLRILASGTDESRASSAN